MSGSENKLACSQTVRGALDTPAVQLEQKYSTHNSGLRAQSSRVGWTIFKCNLMKQKTKNKKKPLFFCQLSVLICIMCSTQLEAGRGTSFTNCDQLFDSLPQQHPLLRKQLYCACAKFYSGVQLFGQSTSPVHPVDLLSGNLFYGWQRTGIIWWLIYSYFLE